MCQTLNLDQEEGEKWIVNLIRDTRVDAKIDFEEVSVRAGFEKKERRIAGLNVGCLSCRTPS
jgi:hypothetical protein